MKKLLTLFTLLLCVCSGAWADTTVSATQFTSSQSGTTYTISAKSGYGSLEGIIVQTIGSNGGVGSNRIKLPKGTLNISATGTNVIKSVTISWRDSKDQYPTSNEDFTSSPTGVSTTGQTSTWTGSAASVVFTNNTDNTFQIVGLSVTYGPAPTYKVIYKANGGEGEDFEDNSATTILDVNDCSFTAPSGKVFAGWKDSEETSYAVGATVTSDLTLFAQWVEGSATTITYNLKTNSTSTTLDNCTSATPNSGSIIASTVINIYGTANCDGTNSAKENETQKLKIDDVYTAENYYEWTFTEDNCTFAPTSVQIKFQSVNGLVQYKVALTDGITTKTTNFVQTTSAGNTLETLNWKITDGTVFAANQTIKLQLWAYKKDNNATAFRLGSPITINGIVMTIPSTVSGTITEAGWNTFSSNYALDLSKISGGTAYVATTNDNTVVTMTKTTAKIAAGTGIMIKGTAGDPFTINTTTDAATLQADNQLVGLPNGGTVAAGEYNFVFAWEKEKVSTAGFYYVDIAAPTLPAGKAYLNSEGVNGAKLSIVINDTPSQEETTGIKAVSTTVENGVRYNLAGQKVGKDYKGIVIVNGKKMLNK